MNPKNEVFESVWDALEDDPEEALKMKIRSAMMISIRDRLDKSGFSQADAAKMLKVSQPRVSDLYRGKIHRFNLESLIDLASKAGLQVELNVHEPA